MPVRLHDAGSVARCRFCCTTLRSISDNSANPIACRSSQRGYITFKGLIVPDQTAVSHHDANPSRAKRFRGVRGVIYPVLVALAAVFPGSLMIFAPQASASSNVNFVGNWVPSIGQGWTVTRENHKTGSCVATTVLSKSGYHLVGCHVSGNRYRFTITYGSGYRSNNSGTISGNSLKGSFKDTNGTVETYTAIRKR